MVARAMLAAEPTAIETGAANSRCQLFCQFQVHFPCDYAGMMRVMQQQQEQHSRHLWQQQQQQQVAAAAAG
jgi:hypothetical protein